MVGIAQDDFRAELLEVAMARGLDGALCTDGHEGGRLDHAMRRLELTQARGIVSGSNREAKRLHGLG